MPKGKYLRNKNDDWMPEHDEHLKHLMDTTLMSYKELAVAMREQFPGRSFSRNGVLGRAHRKGWKSRRVSGGQVGFGRAPKERSKAFGNLGVKGAHVGKRKKVAEGLAPVVLASSPLLRDENDPGAKAGPTRKLSLNDPALVHRRKGHIANVVEDNPLTSRPIFETKRDECKWPTSLDVRCMEVCGEPATCGAYCDRHGSVAYRVMPTRKRNGAYHKEDAEHQHRIEHVNMFTGHGGADVFLLEDHSHQDFE